MKRILASAVLLSSLAVAGTASAQFTGPGAYGYVGGSIGQNNYSTDLQCVGTCDKTDTMFKVFGGYMFSPYWGLEAAWGAFGTVKINTTEPFRFQHPEHPRGRQDVGLQRVPRRPVPDH